jgi:hypothetical protein
MLEEIAWDIYCEETAFDMHVADFWEQLSPKVKQIYLTKAMQRRLEH